MEARFSGDANFNSASFSADADFYGVKFSVDASFNIATFKDIELNPALPLTYFNRALAWRAKGDWAQALADYDQMIALNPNYAQAYAQRGLIYLRQGKEREAEKDFAQCLALDKSLTASLERSINEIRRQLVLPSGMIKK